jgi:hypothetical protein
LVQDAGLRPLAVDVHADGAGCDKRKPDDTAIAPAPEQLPRVCPDTRPEPDLDARFSADLEEIEEAQGERLEIDQPYGVILI